MTVTRDGCDCKVGRVIEAYGLSEINEALVSRRTGEAGPPESLRKLADYFNRAVLRQAIEHHGSGGVLDGEIENLYRLLTADDVTRGMRTRAQKQIESDGVDIEAVERSFVSHPTIGRHLNACLEVERPSAQGDRTATAKRRIYKLQSRSQAVVANTLEGLGSTGQFPAEDLTVTVDIRVTCERCGVHAEVGEFVDRGGCDCDASDES